MKSSVIIVLQHNKDGSYRSQDDRAKSLISIAQALYELGYKMESLRSMKQKHIYALLKLWREQGTVGPDAMRNRMSHIRWLMQKWNKEGMVPSNKELKIPPRKYQDNIDKSRTISEHNIDAIKSPLMLHSLRGQQLFGLRMEESLKIKPFIADRDDTLYLHSSWCKGGRERTLPILNQMQRDWLEEDKNLVGDKNNSLIPTDTKYITYRERFRKACSRAGISRKHGLRHHYVQERYKELAGWDCPAKGGPSRMELIGDQKIVDREVRLQISTELGHGRIDVVKRYCGQ